MMDSDGPLLAALRELGLDTVRGAFAYGGGQQLDKPGLGSRSRTRVVLNVAGQRQVVYLKRYGRQGPLARLSRRVRGDGAISRGRREYDNIRAVRAAGVPTMRELLVGEDMGLLGERRSYVVFSEVAGDALSRRADLADRLRDDEPLRAELTRRLVELVARLHAAGLVHRDLYASHVFAADAAGGLELSLIDLARVFAPRRRRFRWFVKDLASLKFSMPRSWVQPCWDRFLCDYLLTAGALGVGPGGWQQAIAQRERWMRRREQRKLPAAETR
jgi:tRNA A-37 threonylcarbamoyl transferase component Bud32